MIVPDNRRNIIEFFEQHGDCYPINGVYLHGELLELTGIDTFYVTKSSEFNIINNNKDIDGMIFDIDVCVSKDIENKKMETKKATAFIWRNKILNVPRGLIILKGNEADYEYANEKYENKDTIL